MNDHTKDGQKEGMATAPSTANKVRRARGRYPAYTRGRLKQFSSHLRRAIYPESVDVERIEILGPTDRISYEEALSLAFRDARVGEILGPRWATYWAKVSARVPASWRGGRVDLYWDSRSEALLWLNGKSVQGLNPGRYTATLTERASGGEEINFVVEIACNGMFGALDESVRTGTERYQLMACELRLFDQSAFDFYYDFDVLRQLEEDREPQQSPRSFGGVARKLVRPALDTSWAGRLLHELNHVCNIADPINPSSWGPARPILKKLLAAANADFVHELSAIGHAHLDTAWLWPIDETRRKAQRTFATATGLMNIYPEFKFACSQAYQYAIIEESDPDLFGRILEKAAGGQWIPVGGSWVEPDCNLPWGESICRQFLYGQRYFERTFGARSDIFWNPDVFGYDGQLPQLMREAGMTRFLTQKLSWNRFTSPPHHSFHWRGIDGSEVLTHFPPADNYNGLATMEELRYHAANYRDADRSTNAYYLFGYGDGGGGANAGMIERLRRTADLHGVPRSTVRTPDEFFKRLESEAGEFGIVEGELYFEYHRGVYTSQAEVKRLNRLCEARLQSLEYLATAARLGGVDAPGPGEIERLWRVVLTNQFHDILPGSSIGEVYVQTRRELADTADAASRMSERLLEKLAGSEGPPLPVNTTGFARNEIAEGPDDTLYHVTAQPFSAGRTSAPSESVHLAEDGPTVVLENHALRALLARDGCVLSLVHKASGREALDGPGNRILLHDDQPLEYEAWDIDPFALETARDAPPANRMNVVATGPLRAEIRFERRIGEESLMVQTVRLDAGARHLVFDNWIEWRERRVLVKVMFPLAVRARNATYETMFGVAERPTHANTDADLAMYEVPGHRWADVSEPDFGVSLLSDSRHGFSCFENRLALSLMRGPVSPDETADLGEHRFRYALYPHQGNWRDANTVAEGTCFARPLLWARGEASHILARPLVEATPRNVVIDTIKPAEDGDGWIVRLYESGGQRGQARLQFHQSLREAWKSNTLEDRMEHMQHDGAVILVSLRPFQILTLRVK